MNIFYFLLFPSFKSSLVSPARKFWSGLTCDPRQGQGFIIYMKGELL